MGRTVGVLAAGTVLASGVTVGTADAAGTATPGPADLAWKECADVAPDRAAKPECATLEVPLDHRAGAASRTIRIALSRVPARRERAGVLLVNPGGPGSAGREWAARTAQRLPEDLRDRYDVVGFDPRGTGASHPAVSCDPKHFDPVAPDTVPRSAGDEKALWKRATAYAEACANNNGALLRHMRTDDSARDIEAIRAALGTDRIDYLGYSYGTYLGGVYATLYPDRVRRLVLDSVVHPGRPWFRSNLAQSRSLDAAAGLFFDWVARHESAYGLGATGDAVAERYYEARDRLREDPAKDTVGPAELEGTYINAAYGQETWPDLARALADYVNRGDPTALRTAHEQYGEGADSEPAYGAYLATQCTDAPWPREWPTWRDAGRATHARAPFQGWSNLWYNAPCASWRAPSRQWVEVDGRRVRDALLIQATEDGPTPRTGAFAMRERIPSARLVTEDGGASHGVALDGNDCVDDILAAYLRDGRLPRSGGGANGADATCAAPPAPDPDSVS